MKTIQSIAAFFAIILLITSCGPSKDKLNEKINSLEAELFTEQARGVDKEKAKELLNTYIEFADEYPEDPQAPVYLFKAADISMNIVDSGQAVDIYDRILANYPEFDKAPQCLFLKAFVYENNMRDMANAQKYYREFLEKYPEDDFADDAQMSLENLGKSPEQLIREFEEKMKANQNSEE